MGKTPNIEIKEREAEFKEIPEQYLDSGRIKEDIGWEPTHDLNEGLQKTVDWYMKFFREI